jgi:hypothetical protein
VSLQRAEQRCLIRGASAAAHHHYKIDPTQGVLPHPESFTGYPFEVVSVMGLPNLPLGNCQPQPREIQAVDSRQHNPSAVGRLSRLFENPFEIGGFD